VIGALIICFLSYRQAISSPQALNQIQNQKIMVKVESNGNVKSVFEVSGEG